MGCIPRRHQVELTLERLDLRSVIIYEFGGTPDLARRFASGQAMGTNGPFGPETICLRGIVDFARAWLALGPPKHTDESISGRKFDCDTGFPPARE
jgi:hypothetical protein